ncbi:MAG: hypothetical protein R3C59_24770 [Planctomycetaceae bacterium]
MWWHRRNHRSDDINPYLGVGYTIPEQWSARKHEAVDGIQFLPPVTQSAYPAAIFLRVFPDKQNISPEYAIDTYVTAKAASATRFEPTGREFKVHPSGFVYASIEYTIETNSFTRSESHHLIAFDIDGRTSVTASACCNYWQQFVPIRDSFIASLVVCRPEVAIADHFREDGPV